MQPKTHHNRSRTDAKQALESSWQKVNWSGSAF